MLIGSTLFALERAAFHVNKIKSFQQMNFTTFRLFFDTIVHLPARFNHHFAHFPICTSLTDCSCFTPNTKLDSLPLSSQTLAARSIGSSLELKVKYSNVVVSYKRTRSLVRHGEKKTFCSLSTTTLTKFNLSRHTCLVISNCFSICSSLQSQNSE